MTTIAIVVSTPVGGIGIKERMPWLNLTVMKDNYTDLAKDRIVLVGKTAFGQDYIRGEETYVYTRSEDFISGENIHTISGEPEEVIAKLNELHPDKDIIIGGGELLFTGFYDLIDEWRVTIVDEFVIYDRDLNLTDIQYRWKKHRLVATGVDNNLNFSVWHYTKE